MSNTILTLMSHDRHQFTIEKEIAIKSRTIKKMVEVGCVSSEIPLPNLDSETLALVIECLKKLAENDLKSFVEDKEFSTLVVLVEAANYLDIEEMIDIVCQKIADLMAGMTVEQLRSLFHIQNDFAPEEEQAIHDGHAWALDI